MHLQVDRDLLAALRGISGVQHYGKVCAMEAGSLKISGLAHSGRIGDQITVECRGRKIGGELIALNRSYATAQVYENPEGVALGDRAELVTADMIWPDDSWLGQVLDAQGNSAAGGRPRAGAAGVPVKGMPPPALNRKSLGARLDTGLAAMNTLLPLARGQRLGIFAGSGVGKSTLLGKLAAGVDADVVVVGLIGERGREVREFVENALGPKAMAKSIVVAATSDQSPLLKRRAAWTAMAIAEHFRDLGKHVLLVLDSLTRFAEAHREIGLAVGEKPGLSAFPPSTANVLAALVERAGPGAHGKGDISGIFSVLVAGSDMDEPVADMARGLLDGHIVLDRAIAERGRFPAIDVRRSVSRSIQKVATHGEQALAREARQILAIYHDAETLVQSGLYAPGSNADIDRALRLWPALDAFSALSGEADVAASFTRLEAIVAGIDSASSSAGPP